MSRHLERKQAERRAKTFANPPSTVTLPGNVKLLAYHFRITAVDRHGRPHAFEVTRDKELPPDAKVPYDATLWAAPEFMDDRIDPKLKERMDARGEAQSDLQQLMTYVDEAKRAAGTERVTGEPLPEFIARLVSEVRALRQDPDLASLDPGEKHYAKDAKRCGTCGSSDVKGEGMGCEVWRYVCRTCGADPA